MKTAERYVKSYTAKSVSAFDMEKSNKIRHPEIDILRGIALLMMLVLHVIWCMDYLDFNVNMNIYFIQPVVPALFLMLAGISLHLSYCRNENYKNWLKSSIRKNMILIALGLMITVISVILFPNMPVIFGILSCIGFSLFVGIIFMRLSVDMLVVSTIPVIVLGFFISNVGFENNYLLYIIGFKTSISSLDYFPILPWLWCIMFGIILGKLWYPNGIRDFKINIPERLRLLNFMGKHSLAIYLIHMPIIYTIITFIKMLFP